MAVDVILWLLLLKYSCKKSGCQLRQWNPLSLLHSTAQLYCYFLAVPNIGGQLVLENHFLPIDVQYIEVIQDTAGKTVFTEFANTNMSNAQVTADVTSNNQHTILSLPWQSHRTLVPLVWGCSLRVPSWAARTCPWEIPACDRWDQSQEAKEATMATSSPWRLRVALCSRTCTWA